SYPEGGWSAWIVVLGSWMACFGSMGLMNSLGIFQAYLSEHQLLEYSSSSISWIFGVYSCLTFFCGVQIGPIFDAKGPRGVIFLGALGTVLFLLGLGFCTKYWHFMLTFGVFGGISLALVFGPSVSIVAHYFSKRRGLATGIASSGGSIGGIVFPIASERLFYQVGFAWTTRVLALLCLFTFTVALLTIRRRFPTKPISMAKVLPDLSAFSHGGLALTSLGVFFLEWGLFVPFSYLPSYALSQHLSSEFSYSLLSVVNAAAVFGRLIPGYYADRLGRFNVLILAVVGCMLSNATLWLLAGSSQILMALFAITFGFFSGSTVSLAPVCVGQLCRIELYGRYYATAYVLVSVSALTGIPIAGQLLNICHGEYWGLIVFTACSYAASFICLAMAKIKCCGLEGAWAVF
ncbi:MFS monocarboxylate transporter, partial [Thozetella sp. PMI_491]